jgi:hypothetical protein
MAAEPAPPSRIPTKRIISRAHLQSFLDSPTHTDLVNFLEELNESVVGLKLTDDVPESEVRRLVTEGGCEGLLMNCFWAWRRR